MFAAGLRHVELDDLGRAGAGVKRESCNRYRQREAARAGAARIDEKNLALLLDNGLVRVAGDDRGDAGGGGIEVELGEVVKDVNRVGADLDDVGGGEARSPRAPVVVAAYRAHGCKASQRLEHGGVADVATVNDEVRMPQGVQGFRPRQTVGIRDQSDEIKSIRHVDYRLTVRIKRTAAACGLSGMFRTSKSRYQGLRAAMLTGCESMIEECHKSSRRAVRLNGRRR